MNGTTTGDSDSVEREQIATKGTAAVPGLQQGSKLHRILHEQGDLQQLPAWLQPSEAQQPLQDSFLASPTALSSSQLQQYTPACTAAADTSNTDDAAGAAACDEIVAQLSMALAALQETILCGGAADQMNRLLEAAASMGKDEGDTPRKRLKFDEDTASTHATSAGMVTGRPLQQDFYNSPSAAHALAMVAAAVSAAVDA